VLASPSALRAQVPAQDGPPAINLPLAAWTTVGLKKGFLQEEFDKVGTRQIRLLNPGTTELSGAEAAMLDRGGLAIAQRMMYRRPCTGPTGWTRSWCGSRQSRTNTARPSSP
jgi:hypothetical protein